MDLPKIDSKNFTTAVLVGLFCVILRSGFADPSNSTPSIDALKRVVFNQPSNPSAHDDLGRALASAGQFYEAKLQFNTAIELAPKNEQYLLDLATTDESEGNNAAAESAYSSLVKLNPANGAAEFHLAELFTATGEYKAAVAEFTLAESSAPNSFAVHYEFGELLLAVGGYNEANKEFSLCHGIMPTNTDCLTALATTQQEAGQTALAIITLQSTIGLGTMSPADEASAHMRLASLLILQKQSSDAITELRKAVALTPDDGSAHNALGAALFVTGDTKGATAEWKTALKSHDEMAQTAAKRWLSSFSSD